MGSREFINNKKRYCLWLVNASPKAIKQNKFIIDRLNKVSEFRKTSKTKSVREDASTPSLFTQIRQPDSNYLVVPAMSSGKRKYVPIGFIDKNVIASNQLYIVPTNSLYLFGLLTSEIHMAWMRTVCGRLKSDYRYAPAIYNNFPWPTPDDKSKEKIEKTAQTILDTRSNYPNDSLADLYDNTTMPPDLRKAHEANDKAVLQAYGLPNNASESDILAHLFKMYEKLTKTK